MPVSWKIMEEAEAKVSVPFRVCAHSRRVALVMNGLLRAVTTRSTL